MPSYLFSFRAPTGYEPGGVEPAEWENYFAEIGSAVEDIGNPIFDRRPVGQTGADTKLNGYSVIGADSLDEAVRLAAGCPLIALGGGVEVGEITPVSELNTQSPTADPSVAA
jgi:hypothetical protein